MDFLSIDDRRESSECPSIRHALPRRQDDTAPNLWNVFNVVQENAIRGGLTATGRDANNRPRRATTRAVNGIDQDVKLNRALWTLATRMAELKAA